MALQLKWSHVLPIAVVTGGVAFPALAVLLLQLQVVFHVVHEPVGENKSHTAHSSGKSPQTFNSFGIFGIKGDKTTNSNRDVLLGERPKKTFSQ